MGGVLPRPEIGPSSGNFCLFFSPNFRYSNGIMALIKLIHTADVHIKTSGDEGFSALKEILEKTTQSGAKALIITGDLFDNDQAAFQARADIRELFNSFSGIQILMTPGNHDEGSYLKDVNYGSNITLLSEKPFEKTEMIEGLTIYAVPFQRSAEISGAIKAIAKEPKKSETFSILLSHGTLIDQWLKDILVYLSQYEKESESFYIHGDDLKKGPFNLVLLGHYHNFVERNYDKVTVTYSGSPQATNIKNSGKRRASLIGIDTDKKTSKISEIPLSSSFNISEIFRALPGKEDLLGEWIENFAEKNKDTNACVDLKIEGHILISENEFQKNLDQITKKNKSKFKELKLDNRTRMISSLKSNPTVGQFLGIWERELEQSAKSEEEKEIYFKTLALALEAFEESIIKKKSSK